MTETLPGSAERAVRGSAAPFRAYSSLVRIDVSALSHPGHIRANNEDQFFVTKLARSLETMLSSLPPGDVPERADEVNYLMVVADGMGGHAAGRGGEPARHQRARQPRSGYARLDPEGERRGAGDRAPRAPLVQQVSSCSSSAGARTRTCAAWDRR